MKRENCNRKEAFMEEVSNDWNKLNIAAKSLIIIAIILFICIIFITFYSKGDELLTRATEVVFRSSIASIFGFLLSSNIKGNSIKNLNNLNRFSCEDEIDKYNYEDGNIIQIVIAIVVCIVSIIVILIIYVTNNNWNVAAVSQLRDFMCTSIGFLLGESKIKK